jgi:hypothetical protein
MGSAPSSPLITFSPDGASLQYADGNVLRRYYIDDARLVELARTLSTRALTDDECQRYLEARRCA